MKCEYINNSNNCKFNKKYGNFCYKHRKHYLLKDNLIIFNRFTWKSKDYTLKDIKGTLSHLHPKNRFNLKKDELFKLLIPHIINTKGEYIVKCQSYIRRYLIQKNIKRGPGYFYRDLCKNDEDFYFMTTSNEIKEIYCFTYKDDDNSIWFFDIRSFKKLIDTKPENPYTRKPIPQNIINNAQYIINYLISKNISADIEIYNPINQKDKTKQKCVDLFSTISQSGYYCDINWLLSLNLMQCKKLYRSLEDIWNFRAYLTNDIKSNIAPPNGLVYNISVREIYDMNNKFDILNIILNETNKFNNAVSMGDTKLGYMYFLIGLSEFSRECLIANEWIQFIL